MFGFRHKLSFNIFGIWQLGGRNSNFSHLPNARESRASKVSLGHFFFGQQTLPNVTLFNNTCLFQVVLMQKNESQYWRLSVT